MEYQFSVNCCCRFLIKLYEIFLCVSSCFIGPRLSINRDTVIVHCSGCIYRAYSVIRILCLKMNSYYILRKLGKQKTNFSISDDWYFFKDTQRSLQLPEMLNILCKNDYNQIPGNIYNSSTRKYIQFNTNVPVSDYLRHFSLYRALVNYNSIMQRILTSTRMDTIQSVDESLHSFCLSINQKRDYRKIHNQSLQFIIE